MVTAIQDGTWMDKEGFKNAFIKEEKKRGDIHQPLYGTWAADFMLRQDAGKFMLGKFPSDKKIPWQQRRRLWMAVAGNTLTASFSDQNRQDAISRVSAVQNSAKGQR